MLKAHAKGTHEVRSRQHRDDWALGLMMSHVIKTWQEITTQKDGDWRSQVESRRDGKRNAAEIWKVPFGSVLRTRALPCSSRVLLLNCVSLLLQVAFTLYVYIYIYVIIYIIIYIIVYIVIYIIIYIIIYYIYIHKHHSTSPYIVHFLAQGDVDNVLCRWPWLHQIMIIENSSRWFQFMLHKAERDLSRDRCCTRIRVADSG